MDENFRLILVRPMLRVVGSITTGLCIVGFAHMPLGLNDYPSVTCYDTNHDGVVDFELHKPKQKDEVSRWALVDENYDGFYDYLILYGDTISIREPVHIAVPRNVQISLKQFNASHPQHATNRSNQSLEPTAGRRDAHH